MKRRKSNGSEKRRTITAKVREPAEMERIRNGLKHGRGAEETISRTVLRVRETVACPPTMAA